MVLFHGNDATLTPVNTWFAFSDTPADTPRDTGFNDSDAIGDPDVANDDTCPFACKSEFIPAMRMAKNSASNKNPEMTTRAALLGGQRLSRSNSPRLGRSSRGVFDLGKVASGSSCFDEKNRNGVDSSIVYLGFCT